ncbi:hypothetical protein MKX01_013253 [Papaver californicum]|nr:hypothetical protein MKX01_013253 [Papaver californicum]
MLMQQNMNGDTPLHMAVRLGSTGIVKLFVDHAPNSQSRRDENYDNIDVEKGMTFKGLRFEALRYQTHSGIPQLLISADPGFEYLPNDSDETPLYLWNIYSRIVQLLVMMVPPGGRTALHALALQISNSFRGASPKLVHLLRHIVKEVDKDGRTALHYAVCCGNVEFVDAVIKVDPSICYMSDKDGMTALHHAARLDRRINVLKKMLERCMDCWQVLDNKGRSFLHVAVENNQLGVFDYVVDEISSVLEVEAIISMKDKQGNHLVK